MNKVNSTQNQASYENVIVIYPPSNTLTSATDSSDIRRRVTSQPEAKPKWFMPPYFKKLDKTKYVTLCELIKAQRKEGPKNNQKMIWCFRELYTTTAFMQSKRPDIAWTPFQQKNQILLTQQLEQFERDIQKDSCTLQDRKIRGGKLLVTVWLNDTMAFALDPELSEPITFEIARLPKLNWYQKMVIRHQHRQFQRMSSNK